MTGSKIRNINLSFGKKCKILLLLLLTAGSAFGQPQIQLIKDSAFLKDTIVQKDSTIKTIDSTGIKNFLFTRQILKKHPYFNFSEKAVAPSYSRKEKPAGKELYFYILAGILLVFAIFRTAFDKYFSDLITLFFRRSLKQRQLKQQVSQNSLPSLLFNILYVLTAGFYIALLIKEFGSASLSFWQLLIYAIIFISIIYVVKFLVLKLAGWMFQMKAVVEDYIFIIFLVNKIIGIVLLPVIVVVALGSIGLKTTFLTLSWLALLGLYFYRYVVAFGLLRKEKSISIFHFILYLLAMEVLPMIVIYKAISNLLNL